MTKRLPGASSIENTALWNSGVSHVIGMVTAAHGPGRTVESYQEA